MGLLVAEVSFKSTSQGIELGWADFSKVPIAFLYREGSNLPNSLRKLSSLFVSYSNDVELVEDIERAIKQV